MGQDPQRLDLKVSPEVALSMLANAHVQYMMLQQETLTLQQENMALRRRLTELQPPPLMPKD